MAVFRCLRFFMIASLWWLAVAVLAGALSIIAPFPAIYSASLLIVVFVSALWYRGLLGQCINFWVLLFSAISIFSIHYHLSDWLQYQYGAKVALPVSPSGISAYPQAHTFRLHSAIVRPAFSSEVLQLDRSRSGGANETYYHAAPLTDTQWQPGEPVPAWIVERTGYPVMSFGIDTPVVEVVSAGYWNKDAFRRATERAAAVHRLRMTGEPRMFEVASPNITTVVHHRMRRLLILGVGPYVFFCCVTLLGLCTGWFAREQVAEDVSARGKRIIAEVEARLRGSSPDA